MISESRERGRRREARTGVGGDEDGLEQAECMDWEYEERLEQEMMGHMSVGEAFGDG